MSRPNCFGEPFAHVQKKWKWHKAAAVFVLNLRHKTAVGASTWVSQIYTFFSSILSKCWLPIFWCLYPMGEAVTSICVENALVVSTNIWLLCYARSCFLQQEISTFWPDSSKHLLLCPLILEEGPISSVYHLLLLPLPHIISVQHFAKVPSSSLSWKEVFRSHFWTFGLDCHNICS